MPNAFSVNISFMFRTQGCRCAPTTGLKLANAFGVYLVRGSRPENNIFNVFHSKLAVLQS